MTLLYRSRITRFVDQQNKPKQIKTATNAAFVYVCRPFFRFYDALFRLYKCTLMFFDWLSQYKLHRTTLHTHNIMFNIHNSLRLYGRGRETIQIIAFK